MSIDNLNLHTSHDLIANFDLYIKREALSFDKSDFHKIDKWIESNKSDNQNPYVYLELMKRYAEHSATYAKAAEALDFIIDSGFLFRGMKRRPMLELIFRTFYEWKHIFNLNENEAGLIMFAIKLGYDYPGIVGTAYNIYAIKEQYNTDSCKEASQKIVESQNSTHIEGINANYWISQTKGGLSLDLGFGCSMGCAYCYRIEDHGELYSSKLKPKFLQSPSTIVDKLLAHPWFTPHVTPLGLHMSTMEAFTPQTWPITIEVLEKLDGLNLTNRITIITKGTLDEDEISRLEALKYLDLDICVCYSGLSTKIEPTSSAKRLEFLARLIRGNQIVPIAYFRPLIEGHNTSVDDIMETLNAIKKSGAKIIVYGGLLFSEEHADNFQKIGIQVPVGKFEKNKKYISDSTEEAVKILFDEIFSDVDECALYRHSSCGRVNARGKWLPDYNCHFYMDTSDRCYKKCRKKAYCMNPMKPSKEDMDALMERLFRTDGHYEIADKYVKFNRKLNLYENNFIRQNTLFPIAAETI